MRLIITGDSGKQIGWIEDREGHIVANPPQLADLMSYPLQSGMNAREALASRDGWSNGFAFAALVGPKKEE